MSNREQRLLEALKRIEATVMTKSAHEIYTVAREAIEAIEALAALGEVKQ